MLIVVDQLLLKFDDIKLVKADYESETKTMSQFRWLKPKTWFLTPIVEKNKKYYVQIFLRSRR